MTTVARGRRDPRRIVADGYDVVAERYLAWSPGRPSATRKAWLQRALAEIRPLLADRPGRIVAIDNRKIAKLAKLAGAPEAKAAGVELSVKVGDLVSAGQPMCTVHAEAPGELAYALDYAAANPGIISVGEP